MTRQATQDRTDREGRLILRRGERYDARPTRRLGYWRVRVDGTSYRVPAEALEPVDDVDLPAPEPVRIEVLLRESAGEWRLPPPPERMSWPIAVVAMVVLAVLMGAAFMGRG